MRDISSEESLPRGIDHVGITVPDLEAATDFFARAFGAALVHDLVSPSTAPLHGREVEQQLGTPEGSQIVRIRLLRIGNGPTLELFQFESAEQTNPVALKDLGWNHVCFYVDDIEAAAKCFEDAGGTLLTPPHPTGSDEVGQRSRGVYGRAPWGSLIELLSYPDTVQYPDQHVQRWTPQPR